MIDLKGFDWRGRPWSWPEWDELTGLLHRPAHALGLPGMTVCGEAWPHQWDERTRGATRSAAPNDPQREFADGVDPWAPPRMAPSRANRERLKADVGAHLCAECAMLLRVEQAGHSTD